MTGFWSTIQNRSLKSRGCYLSPLKRDLLYTGKTHNLRSENIVGIIIDLRICKKCFLHKKRSKISCVVKMYVQNIRRSGAWNIRWDKLFSFWKMGQKFYGETDESVGINVSLVFLNTYLKDACAGTTNITCTERSPFVLRWIIRNPTFDKSMERDKRKSNVKVIALRQKRRTNIYDMVPWWYQWNEKIWKNDSKLDL